MINKKMFVDCISAIQQQEEHDKKCIEAFQAILNEDRIVIGYNNSKLSQQLITLLETILDDKGGWIGYFIYELDYGKDYTEGCITNKDNFSIDISTIENLYEFLLKESFYTYKK